MTDAITSYSNRRVLRGISIGKPGKITISIQNGQKLRTKYHSSTERWGRTGACQMILT